MANIFTKFWRKLTGGGGQVRPMQLEVAGSPDPVSVIPVEHDGGRYLVADRADAAWVERIRLSGRGRLTIKDRRMPVTAVEVPVEERAAIIAAYRAKAGDLADAAAWTEKPDPADHPVFRLDRDMDASRGGGAGG